MTSPPRVAVITPGSFPIPSPTSSSVERVVEQFVPLLRPFAEPRIYGRTALGLPRVGQVADVVCERFPASNKLHYIEEVSRAIQSFSPSIIQVENRPQYMLKLRERHPAAKLWLNLHSSTFITPSAIAIPRLHQSLQAADRILVNSQYLRRIIAARAPEAAAKLRVIYPGVQTDRFLSQYSVEGESRRAAIRQDRGLQGRKVILFMGRLLPLKGVHHLLHIAPALIAEHPNVKLVIVGSPFYGSHRTTAYARELFRIGAKYPSHIAFIPYVPYTKVPDWFLAADIAVVPSGSREAFGLVNVEAMASGVPVVATRAGGIREIIRNGQTGYLIRPESIQGDLLSHLSMLLRDDILREQMGRASRERVEQTFTWRRTADRWLDIMREPWQREGRNEFTMGE
ncbi:glycosyltransferase family 4 protein [Paenibacillus sp. GCM10023252]|uniref:glycosyltransferase family 4 protein n=1 Tax=Paenibacillus sp. GCM10023252 TaxID=3252649 RepID=UPI00361EA6FE